MKNSLRTPLEKGTAKAIRPKGKVVRETRGKAVRGNQMGRKKGSK